VQQLVQPDLQHVQPDLQHVQPDLPEVQEAQEAQEVEVGLLPFCVSTYHKKIVCNCFFF